MTITQDEKVLIGLTTAVGNPISDKSKVHIQTGGTNQEGLIVEKTNADNTTAADVIINNAGNTGIAALYVSNAGSGTGIWTDDIKSTAYYYTSDKRLKKDITQLDNALDKIIQIDGVNFKWKDKEKGTNLKMGLIAQNVEAVYPELVNTDPEGVKSVEYANLVAALIEAIKELKNENDALKSKLDVQSAEYKALNEKIEAQAEHYNKLLEPLLEMLGKEAKKSDK